MAARTAVVFDVIGNRLDKLRLARAFADEKLVVVVHVGMARGLPVPELLGGQVGLGLLLRHNASLDQYLLLGRFIVQHLDSRQGVSHQTCQGRREPGRRACAFWISARFF